MQNQKKSPARFQRYIWYFGFMGFMGFKYFIHHDPAALFYFSFFSFFGYYFTSKLALEMPDERYRANRQQAQAFTLWVPVIALFLIGFGSLFSFGTREFVIIVSAAGWAGTFITYAIAFYYFEKHGV